MAAAVRAPADKKAAEAAVARRVLALGLGNCIIEAVHSDLMQLLGKLLRFGARLLEPGQTDFFLFAPGFSDGENGAGTAAYSGYYSRYAQ